MRKQQQVYVALSGGVDSAVAAIRLLNKGFHVTGIHMQTWKDSDGLDRTAGSMGSTAFAAQVAESIGVPFVSLDVRGQFYQIVIRRFIQEYLAGQTPNPCLFCNPQVKWGLLQTYAVNQGADYFATGHYARAKPGRDGRVQLLRGIDRTKDQSYVLAMLSNAQLERSLLPLGEMTKEKVRSQARELNLPVAERAESQDLCFLGNIDYRDFLKRFSPDSAAPGEIISIDGKVLGEHQGLAFYTIGQRRGIKIAAPEPYYVVGKDIEGNRLIVGFAAQAGKRHLSANHPNWIAGLPPKAGQNCEVMIRYRAQPVTALLISASSDDFRLEFNQNLRGITPGQVAVLYQGEVCLGGGIIQTGW